MTSHFSTVESAIAAFGRGEIVIVVDAEDRENEGDFICAAEKVTPEIVNFMLRHGRGQVCVPLLPEVCERLKLAPMVAQNAAPLRTAFTVAVDHHTARTGITAQEKATTILALIDPRSQPADFVRPGHMYPIMAKEGGVLRRAGHTEAAIDRHHADAASTDGRLRVSRRDVSPLRGRPEGRLLSRKKPAFYRVRPK